MRPLSILVLGPDCNPEEVSIPFVTYSHAAALAELHEVTLVVRAKVEDAVRRSNAPFRSIEVIKTPTLDRIFAWGFQRIFKGSYDGQALTAFRYPFSILFEVRAWQKLRRRILAREFDLVLRVSPLTAVLPSPFAFFLKRARVPFVIGPISGGLPWPPGFSQLQKQKEWIAGLRGMYRFLPFARSTYRNAAAIIAASSQTYSEFVRHREKMFFIPENGIRGSICFDKQRNADARTKLELIFVGGLVPRKACDLALRGAASLLRKGFAHFTVVGDGPERGRLEELTRDLEVENSVTFTGWLSHDEVLGRMRRSDVFVFPSVRDFGGGVVFEALAAGSVPVVVDFGGPGDIVNSEIGFKVPFSNETDVVLGIEKILESLANDEGLLHRLQDRGVLFARKQLTWEAKAEDTTRVLQWVVGQGPKPELLPPKMLAQAK